MKITKVPDLPLTLSKVTLILSTPFVREKLGASVFRGSMKDSVLAIALLFRPLI